LENVYKGNGWWVKFGMSFNPEVVNCIKSIRKEEALNTERSEKLNLLEQCQGMNRPKDLILDDAFYDNVRKKLPLETSSEK
jgi:hypothetical protein